LPKRIINWTDKQKRINNVRKEGTSSINGQKYVGEHIPEMPYFWSPCSCENSQKLILMKKCDFYAKFLGISAMTKALKSQKIVTKTKNNCIEKTKEICRLKGEKRTGEIFSC
jgi:hypothetical protein